MRFLLLLLLVPFVFGQSEKKIDYKNIIESLEKGDYVYALQDALALNEKNPSSSLVGVNNKITLAAAYFMTQQDKYLEKALEILRQIRLDIPNKKSAPSLADLAAIEQTYFYRLYYYIYARALILLQDPDDSLLSKEFEQETTQYYSPVFDNLSKLSQAETLLAKIKNFPLPNQEEMLPRDPQSFRRFRFIVSLKDAASLEVQRENYFKALVEYQGKSSKALEEMPKVENLVAFNTVYDEHSPSIGRLSEKEPTLIYTRRSPPEDAKKRDILMPVRDGSFLEDIYSTAGEFSRNKQNNHNASNISIPLPHKEFDILITYKTSLVNTEGNIEFYRVSKKSGKKRLITEANRLINTGNSAETGASYFFDEENNRYGILFASDRMVEIEGQQKNMGRDLYVLYVDKDFENWGEPQRLGDGINTAFDEDAPLIEPHTKYLVYASNDPEKGLGGYDLYYAEPDGKGGWKNPVNYYYPLNTAADDIYLAYAPEAREDGKWLVYFTSTRSEGKGGSDNYRAIINWPPLRQVLFTVKVWDETNEKDVSKLFKVKDFNLEVERISDLSFNIPLYPHFEYMAQMDRVEGYEFYEEDRFDYSVDEEGVRIKIEPPLYIYSNVEAISVTVYVHQKEKDKEPPVVQKPILKPARHVYFDFDKWNLRNNAKQDIEDIVQAYKTIRAFIDSIPKEHRRQSGIIITLEGHTDWCGTCEYNMTLSEQRAQRVYDELIEKGVKIIHLAGIKFKGETQPLGRNRLVGRDYPEGRQLNRRTEADIRYFVRVKENFGYEEIEYSGQWQTGKSLDGRLLEIDYTEPKDRNPTLDTGCIEPNRPLRPTALE